MRKFRLTLAACAVMALLVPMTNLMAVSPDSPGYTHLIYMAGHAGWLHWLVNSWTLLVLHNLFRWYRILFSWLLAVGISYVLLPDLPMVGASVITCFFIGFATPYFWSRSRLSVIMTLALLLMTCILPGFAGLQHIIVFVFGLVFFYAEGIILDIKRYTSS